MSTFLHTRTSCGLAKLREVMFRATLDLSRIRSLSKYAHVERSPGLSRPLPDELRSR
ncbi:hypothetical protein K443DRAFT_364304 [Laccaria amethystina LaAM-08-1]|uniref:Uncharacterized protein n=1 Tax=Laccaria amethystina LaAM-08-1 TaxID=1095629 RepID=A0A0C9WZA1_9AGAR|nr:hypothetical protein K443DRAFT_364304 [Laccaria amethystina LaAM-08-1]